MKNFKIIHQTKHGTRQLLVNADNLHEVLKLCYKNTGTYVNIIKIYEKTRPG